MKRAKLLIGIVSVVLPAIASAQTAAPDYLNPSLPPEVRAKDLVRRMTLEEKASQMTNLARAIPRLKIPAYNWWSESLHGIIYNGGTEFPEPIGLAATFDPASIHAMSHDIAIEGRIRDAEARSRKGYSGMQEGLDFWAPNINIFRDPRWGRGQETYGEDPFLTARMGVAYVSGLQGDDLLHPLAVSTPKHFAVHSGPEPSRHVDDVTVSRHDELDTYLPAFRAAVVQAKAGSVMCAYNSINGEPACANQFLLEDQLRGHWKFNGYVVSDCGAVVDIHEGHHYVPTAAQAAAVAVKRGMDNECVNSSSAKDDQDFRPYIDAVREGYLNESELDRALVRTYTARIRLGLLDPLDKSPYASLDPSLLGGAEHRELALKLADESMVLLKNDGVLPLNKPGTKIALIGPLADETRVLLGNYNGTPKHTVSILEGMRKEFGTSNVSFQPGITFLDDHSVPVPSSLLRADGGVRVTYTYTRQAPCSAGDVSCHNHRTVDGGRVRVIDPSKLSPPPPAAGERLSAIGWKGDLQAREAGDYNLGLDSQGGSTLTVDGKFVEHTPGWEGVPRFGIASLKANQRIHFTIDYDVRTDGAPELQFVWVPAHAGMLEQALASARSADVIVAVAGITSMLEGEEMKVTLPGFNGGDRTSLVLPAQEHDLVEKLAALGKPLVLVLTNGSALAINDESKLAGAVLDAFYPGEEGGTAVAQTLSGRNNPSGRLPITFYTGVDQLPPFKDYSMNNRTYRYFTGRPLYPFGYGLSYTSFAYSGLHIVESAIRAGEPLKAQVTITNTGRLAGDEIAQAYLTFPKVPGAPLVALRGFERISLQPGESKTVTFTLAGRDLGMVTADGQPRISAGKYRLSVGGGQPAFDTGDVSANFEIVGNEDLPD